MRLMRLACLLAAASLAAGGLPAFAAAAPKSAAPAIIGSFSDLHYAEDAIFSPDNRILATRSDGGGVTLWDLSSALPLRSLATRAYLTGAVFTKNGKRMLTGHKDGAVRLWDVESGAVLHAFRGKPRDMSGEPNAVIGLTIDQTGRHVTAAEMGGAATLWDVASRKALFTLPRSDKENLAKINRIVASRISADGQRLILLASKIYNKLDSVGIYDSKTGTELSFFDLPEDHVVVENGLVTDDTAIVLVSSGECPIGQLMLFSLTNRAIVAPVLKPALCQKPKDADDPKPLTVHAGHDAGRVVISQEGNPELHIFDVAARKIERTLRLPDGTGTRVLGVSHDFKLIAIGEAGRVSVRALDTGALVTTLRSVAAPTERMTIGPDATHVVAQLERDGGSKALVTIGMRRLADLQTAVFKLALPEEVRLADFAVGPRLALGERDDKIVLLSLDGTGEPKTFSIAPLRSTKLARLSPDGKTAVVNGHTTEGDDREHMLVVDLVDGKTRPLAIEASDSEITGLVFAADGKRIAAGFRDGSAEVFDIASARSLRKLPPYSDDGDTRPIAFSADGSLLAGGATFDNNVFVWNVETGTPMKKITLADGLAGYRIVTAVALSHDKKTIAAGLGQRAISSGDIGREAGGVLVFDLGSGKLRFALRGHRNSIAALAFSKDDRHIVSASYDGTVRFWDHATGKQVAIAAIGADGRWLVLTEGGFYAGPEGSETNVSLVRGLTAMPATAARAVLSRPDLVEALLKGDPDGKYRAAVKDLNRALDLSKITSPR